MKKTLIDHSNKPYSQEKLEVPQIPSPEGHSQKATKPSKCDSENGNTMTELYGLGSTTESFSDQIIMSPNPESNFPRAFISNGISNYKVQSQNSHLKCEINWKITLNTQKSLLHLQENNSTNFLKRLQNAQNKSKYAKQKLEKPHVPLGTSPINFNNEVSNVSQNGTGKLLNKPSF